MGTEVKTKRSYENITAPIGLVPIGADRILFGTVNRCHPEQVKRAVESHVTTAPSVIPSGVEGSHVTTAPFVILSRCAHWVWQSVSPQCEVLHRPSCHPYTQNSLNSNLTSSFKLPPHPCPTRLRGGCPEGAGGEKALCRNDSPSFATLSSPLINAGAKMRLRCLGAAR